MSYSADENPDLDIEISFLGLIKGVEMKNDCIEITISDVTSCFPQEITS